MRFGNQALAFFLLHLAAAKGELYTYTYDGARKQTFKAPKSGRFRITAVGARGGNCKGCKKSSCDVPQNYNWCYACVAQHHKGGYGAHAEGTFYLRKGDKIEMIVGEKGQDCQYVRQLLPDGKATPSGFGYLEALTGAGGGGASSVRIKYADGEQQLLLAAGGGGGAAMFFNGEDGEDGPNGGWDWGGKDGGGGGLGASPLNQHQFSGAGGGGMSGDGGSVKARFGICEDDVRSGLREDESNGDVWAEGGFSVSNGSHGGYVDRHDYHEPLRCAVEVTTRSGSAGGYGSGGQGGAGESLFIS